MKLICATCIAMLGLVAFPLCGANAQDQAVVRVAGGYSHAFGLAGYTGAMELTGPVIVLGHHDRVDIGFGADFEIVGKRCATQRIFGLSGLTRLRHQFGRRGVQAFAGGRVAILWGADNGCVFLTTASLAVRPDANRNSSHFALGLDGGFDIPVSAGLSVTVAASSVGQRLDSFNRSWVSSLRLGIAVPIR